MACYNTQPLHFKNNINCYSYVNRVTADETDHVDFIYQLLNISNCSKSNDNFSTFVNYKITEPPTKVTKYEDFTERFYEPLKYTSASSADDTPKNNMVVKPKQYINIEFYEACYPIRVSLYGVRNVGRIWAQKFDGQWFPILVEVANHSLQSNKLTTLQSYTLQLYLSCDFKTKKLILQLTPSDVYYSRKIEAIMLIGTAELIVPRNPKQNLNNLLYNLLFNISSIIPIHIYDRRLKELNYDILKLQENFNKCCIVCKSDIIESFYKSELGSKQIFQRITREAMIPNDEMVLKILKNLDVTSLSRMSRVNKRLNNLSRDYTLYKYLNLRNIHFTYMHNDLSQLFDYFTPRCKSLRQLDLSLCEFSNSKFRKFVKTCCRNLTHLRLSECFYVDSELRYISEICKNLKELDLNYCYGITNENISYIKNLEFLESLHLEDTNIQTNTLCEMLHKNRHMRDLNLCSCFDLNIDAVAVELQNLCPNLERLNLKDCNPFTSQTIDALAKCKNLKEVNFSGCKMADRVNDNIFGRLFSSCQFLEKIDLSKFERLTESECKSLTLCKNLKSLSLAWVNSVTPDICSQLFVECPKLDELDLSFCEHINGNLVDQWNKIYNVIVYQY
ncbi:PREDICTED: uncharacterized protein LOC105450446 isoform X2 [Wasmannia auropunctata]|uniref:uncharacterized protein LOC105450446 isoform X2 n=1 Tax=Wasmannia auropunctata TaxID=64793 RepID=UPI0005EED943|nr:PREDICTED: uncharacterized protein LOC105450446 isoform X2 [Wasmannia auropunctata]